jgi:hypothetical protein
MNKVGYGSTLLQNTSTYCMTKHVFTKQQQFCSFRSSCLLICVFSLGWFVSQWNFVLLLSTSEEAGRQHRVVSPIPSRGWQTAIPPRQLPPVRSSSSVIARRSFVLPNPRFLPIYYLYK